MCQESGRSFKVTTLERHQVVSEMAEDPELSKIVGEYEHELGSQMSKQVGESAVDLDSRCATHRKYY